MASKNLLILVNLRQVQLLCYACMLSPCRTNPMPLPHNPAMRLGDMSALDAPSKDSTVFESTIASNLPPDPTMLNLSWCDLTACTQELDKVKEENEELRQMADCCFVREQEAKYRCEELESENKELQTVTEQMASTHSRLTQGV